MVQPLLLLPEAIRLPGSHSDRRPPFQAPADGGWGGGWEQRRVKWHRTWCSYRDSAIFRDMGSLIAANLWSTLRVLRQFIMTVFASVLLVCVEEGFAGSALRLTVCRACSEESSETPTLCPNPHQRSACSAGCQWVFPSKSFLIFPLWKIIGSARNRRSKVTILCSLRTVSEMLAGRS